MKKHLVEQVAASMALSGFILTEEDKKRIEKLVDNPDSADDVVQQLIEKHRVKGQKMEQYIKTSKRLSFLLRHCQEPLYIDLNGGWAKVRTILDALHISRETLEQIVAKDEKGRYAFDHTGQRIRANQGHSIPGVVVEMEQPEPLQRLYHGTATRFLDDILREGLKPMNRQFVHISPDYETAVRVGSRHGKPVVLEIDAQRLVKDGYALYRSFNGVWQAKAVPPDSPFIMMFKQEGGV